MNRAWITWTGLAVVALAAAVLSFAALRDLAVLAGTPTALAWLLPVTIDAAALVATRLWLAAGAPERARSFARFLALAMIGLSVAGNAVSHWLVAYQVTPPWWAVVAVAAVPPAVLGAVAHLAAVTSTRQSLVDVAIRDTPAEKGHPERVTPEGVTERSTPDVATTRGTHLVGTPGGGDLVDQARYLVASGEAEGRKVGRARLAAELGVTEHQARQVLRQLDAEKRPSLHAVGGESR